MVEDSDSRNAKQHSATTRWLSKPGVRAAQNEKARLRAARNRAKKKILSNEQASSRSVSECSGTLASRSSIGRSIESPGGSEGMESSGDLACTGEPFDFHELRLMVANWQLDWGAENLWDKTFSDRLCIAQDKGREGVDRFFQRCEKHARKGRALLQRLKTVTPRASRCTTDEIRDLFLQGYELIVAVTSEVKFFEVKVDEYAPAVPMTKVSDIRYY